MRLLIALLACVAALPALAGSWVSAGILTNPATNAIMADTSALPDGGQTAVTVFCGSSVAAIFVVERRDEFNTSNISSQVISVIASGTIEVTFPGITYASNERFRVRLIAGITGQAQCSIIHFGT
jgi:hypothetical protein